jgi:hypothetical protein
MGLIGNKPNQTPTNADLGTMAYEDADYFRGNTEIDTLGTVTTGDIKNSALARSGRATIRPSLLLDFANSKTLDPRITFTRGGVSGEDTDTFNELLQTTGRGATYYGDNGLLKYAKPNGPRFDHNPITGESLGLLIEEQRTNLLTYSEDYGNVAWAKVRSSVTANATTAPDGTTTADKLVEDNTASNTHLVEQVAVTTSGASYTLSVYAKAGERTKFLLSIYTNATTAISFDLTAVTASNASGTITPCANGWYRCSLTFTSGATGNGWYDVILQNASAAYTYTGDGTSGIYIWGAQLEQGAFATSYIPSADSFTSRASTGTFIGSNGLIQSAATNVARYNYNPLNLALSPKLLLEPAATNLLTYSEQFDNANWAKIACTISTNVITAPDGMTAADKLAEDSTSTYHYLGAVPTVTANLQYCATLYAKAGERKVLYLEFSNNSTFPAARFDLSNGTVIDKANNPIAAGIIPVGNGWYRCWVSTTALSTYLGVYIQTNLDDGSRNYTGVTGNGLYIWGAQLEIGTTATSYIPSTSSSQGIRTADISSSAQATRPADSAVITGTNFSSWYRQDEGTIFAKANTINELNSAKSVIGFDDTTLLNRLYLSKKYDLNSYFEVGIFANNIGQTFILQPVIIELLNSFSFSYKVNDIAFVANSSSVNTDTSAIIPNVNRLLIGNLGGGSRLSGHISKLAYYPKRLSNTELQGLTTT